jgi:hypothetical protein
MEGRNLSLLAIHSQPSEKVTKVTIDELRKIGYRGAQVDGAKATFC